MNHKNNRRNTSSKRDIKRLDTKKVRAAERQALGGGRSTEVRSMKWSVRLDQPPILDDTYVPQHPKRKNKMRWCKGKVGRRHDWTLYERPITTWYVERYYRCTKCGKRKWGNDEEMMSII